MPSDILIIPNRNSTSIAPAIHFSGSQGNNIRLEVLTSGSVAFLGKSGSLFSINDSLSGSLMAVGDISGLPILEVFSDDRVVMGRFNSNALVVTGSSVGIGKSTPNSTLDVNGNAIITGSLNITGGITGLSGLGLFAGGTNTNVTLTPNGSGYVNVVQSTSTVETPNYALSVGIASTSNLVSLGNHTNYAWLQSWNTRPLAINPSGNNVGIGTTAPNYRLQVNGVVFASGSGFSSPSSETGYRLKFYDNGGIANDTGIGLEGSGGAEVMWFNSLNGFYFNYGTGGQKITFTSAGNVGINKTTANATLDVNGNTIITGSLTVTNGIQIQGVGSDLIHPFLLMGA